MSIRVFHLLQRAHNALFRAADNTMNASEGIRTAQLAVLFTLLRTEGLPISTIARTVGMGKSSLTGLVDRMMEKDLSRREADPSDARVQRIVLEPKGKAVAKRAGSAVRRYNKGLLEPFSEPEREVIARFLIHVAENADEIVQLDTGLRPKAMRSKKEKP
jgi:DNA-binding MarR family transcriptional regulator